MACVSLSSLCEVCELQEYTCNALKPFKVLADPTEYDLIYSNILRK